ncbi:MAG: endonuclease/exonuclease/phosphatase family protein [Methylobacterium mesophilicum]|nr:endonuclease/exonuclease/phosphatase family protein [Methylobacterium mesophilicum]
MPFRLATFNVENLLRRFDFSGFRNEFNEDRVLSLFEIEDERQFRELEQARAVAATDDTRQLTALAIAATRADIVCLQEVDDLEALEAFERNYLFRMVGEGYRHKFVSMGNDMRGIDVAVMLRERTAAGEPIEFVSSESFSRVTFEELGLLTPELESLNFHPRDRIFRRDCFQVELRIGGRPLTLFVVHLKSMTGNRNGLTGREASMPLRRAEALAVRHLIEKRFGKEGCARAHWAICGDFNDYRERVVVSGDELLGDVFTPVREASPALDVLLADGFAVNLAERRPVLDRWTLFHSRGPRERHLCQLDYILASPALADANPDAVPAIIRNGQPWRTPFPAGQEVQRFPRIGWDGPKASDHCPVAVSLEMPA